MLCSRNCRVFNQDTFRGVIASYNPFVSINLPVNVDLPVVIYVGFEPDPSSGNTLAFDFGWNGNLDPVPGKRESNRPTFLDI